MAYELAFAGLRATGDSVIRQLTMSPAQARPGATRAWLVGADSAELNYFGVARSGYKFDSNGRLLRADWRNTTYRYRIDRVAAPDVDTKVAEWANADQRGSGVGALSPRDTTRAAFDGASFTIDYSRPAKRGRNVWGDVVQPGQVWRLGADVATHFTSSRDIRLGDADIPAGAYTLWMVMAADGSAQLIVNKQTGIFGTQYKSANDLVRIALRRDRVAVAERLTLKLEGRELSIWWDDVAWRVPVSVK